MNADSIAHAVAEANRFLRAAEAHRAKAKLSGEMYGNRESGSLRRASLDLTRALADMRRWP
jgi:hypothetical protein